MGKCKISVIMPAFNAVSTIKDCIKSLKEQDFKDYEIIVVDDNSKDNTYDLVKNLCKVIKNYGKRGAGSARNSGARIAKSKILAFIDSDCIAPRGWLNKIYNSFNERDCNIVTGPYGKPSINNQNKFNYYELKYRQRKLCKFVTTFSSNNFAIRKEVFVSSCGFPEYIHGAAWEDTELSLNLSRRYQIFWKNDLNVSHSNNYSEGFFKRQIICSAGTVFLILKHLRYLFMDTHESRSHPEALFIFLFFFSLVITLFNKYILLVSLILFLIIVIINLFFINYLIKNKNNLLFVIKSIFWIFLRDIIWFIGIFFGVKYFIEYKITKKVSV